MLDRRPENDALPAVWSSPLYLLTVLFLLACLPSLGQRFVLPSGEYMDTTRVRNTACDQAGLAPYYSVHGKYPRSSETLLNEVRAFLRQKNQAYRGSGYVTFRFAVDCAGQRRRRVQVLQTDAGYQGFHFRPALVEELYLFLQTLTAWRAATTPTGAPVNYLAYLTFKLHDGKVVAVIP